MLCRNSSADITGIADSLKSLALLVKRISQSDFKAQ
jgi:hypothetical protein